jgi:hypothetical protein
MRGAGFTGLGGNAEGGHSPVKGGGKVATQAASARGFSRSDRANSQTLPRAEVDEAPDGGGHLPPSRFFFFFFFFIFIFIFVFFLVFNVVRLRFLESSLGTVLLQDYGECGFCRRYVY